MDALGSQHIKIIGSFILINNGFYITKEINNSEKMLKCSKMS